MSERYYFLDWVRVFCLATLLVYHCNLAYFEPLWLVSSAHVHAGSDYFALVTCEFRLPALFLTAGAAIRFLMEKRGPGPAIVDRFKRLGWPLVFGLAVLVPIQDFIAALSHGRTLNDALLLAADPFNAATPLLLPGHVLFEHLWFLPFLLVYSTIAAALFALGPEVFALMGHFVRRALTGRGLIFVPGLLFVVAHVMTAMFPRTCLVWNDPANNALYGTAFVIGLFANRDTFSTMDRQRWAALAVAAVAGVLRVLSDHVLEPYGWPAMELAHHVTAGVFGWCVVIVLVGFAHRYLDRPSGVLNRFNQIAMPVYVLHQPVMLVAFLAVAPLKLDQWSERGVVLAATLVGSVALAAGVFSRSRRLRFAVGLRPHSAQTSEGASPEMAPAHASPAHGPMAD